MRKLICIHHWMPLGVPFLDLGTKYTRAKCSCCGKEKTIKFKRLNRMEII